MLQTVYQTQWQPAGYHLILSSSDIIRDPVEPEYTGLTIIDRIAGSGVSIPGLPHPTRIDNQSASG